LKLRELKGLTLPEVLVATIVFLLCTGAVISSWLMLQKMYKAQIGTIDTRRELRSALHRMNADFKMAEMIYFGTTFTYGIDPNGNPITHKVPSPGQTDYSMVVAIPEFDSDGVFSNKYTLVAYILEALQPYDDLNPDAYQLKRFSRSHVNGTDPSTFSIQTLLINHSSTVTTILAKYIQPGGLEFHIFPNSRGIQTAAIRVKRALPNAPPVYQRIESGYYMRNNR